MLWKNFETSTFGPAPTFVEAIERYFPIMIRNTCGIDAVIGNRKSFNKRYVGLFIKFKGEK